MAVAADAALAAGRWDKDKAKSWASFQRTLVPAPSGKSRVQKVPPEVALQLKDGTNKDNNLTVAYFKRWLASDKDPRTLFYTIKEHTV